MPELRIVVGSSKQSAEALARATGLPVERVTGGDTKVEWNPNVEAEVEVARNTFDTLRGKRYSAFRVNSDGTPGARIDRFSRELGSVIMTPQLAGGSN